MGAAAGSEHSPGRSSTASRSPAINSPLCSRPALPRTAWEYDAVGRSLLQAGKLEQAREIIRKAIQLEPDAFWPYFHLTLCAYRLRAV